MGYNDWYDRLVEAAANAEVLLTKEQAACCQSRLDDEGRPPIGWCSPTCERRIQAQRLRRRR